MGRLKRLVLSAWLASGRRWCFAWCVFALSGIAHAQQGAEIEMPTFSFSGFGTLGVVHSSEHRADYVLHRFQESGAGLSKRWSPEVDSRVGGQVTARITPHLTGVVQAIAEQSHDGSYRPQLEWANLKYNFSPDSSLRAGRFVVPIFTMSVYRKVAYAIPWARSPVEVYRLMPATYYDGVEYAYRHRFGEVTNTLTTSLTDRTVRTPTGGQFTCSPSISLNNTAEFGAFTLHAAASDCNLSTRGYEDLHEAFNQFSGYGGAEIADKYFASKGSLSLFSVGVNYDPGRWFVAGEWAYIRVDGVFGNQAAWYLSAGRRLGQFTPYVTYAQARAKGNLSDSGLSLSPGDEGYEQAQLLNTTLNHLLATRAVQDTLSVGMRWDFSKNAALKFQFDHGNAGAGSYGVLNNIRQDMQTGEKFNVFSMTLDFVF